MLQEVSNLLPEDERGQVLDDIQRVSKERRRSRKPHSLDPPPTLYKPVPESGSLSLADIGDKTSVQWLTASFPHKSLLGNHRFTYLKGFKHLFEKLLSIFLILLSKLHA